MNRNEYRSPTEAEMRAIMARAHKMRAEATREMFAALGRTVARGWTWLTSKPAGWRIGAN